MNELDLQRRQFNHLIKADCLQDVIIDILRMDLNQRQIIALIEGRVDGHRSTADMLAKQITKQTS